MNIIIRAMRSDDIADIMYIRTSVKENHMSVEDLEQKNITPETIKQMIEITSSVPYPNTPYSDIAWVALYNDKIIGFAMIDIEEGCVFALFVDDIFHGYGAGKKLLQQAEDALFKHYQTIWLSTAINTRAAQFYKNQNWLEVSCNDNGDIRFEKSLDLKV